VQPLPVALRTPVHHYRTAIIDIGSNSVRLVIYSGPRRNPAVIFNEKVMAGLGAALADTGAIDAASMARAVEALQRFARLAELADVDETVCVATAAVRDASNGDLFAAQVRALGIDLTVLSGSDEAEIAALGVLSAIPDAEGIVGDLGGGSLDPARIANGRVHETATLPLGVLRAAAVRRGGPGKLEAALKRMLAAYPWLKAYPDLPFYLVGGSWRAAARLDMHLTHYPLRVLHQYGMAIDRPTKLGRALGHIDRETLRGAAGLPSSRIDTLADAIVLMRLMGRHLRTSGFIVSSYGLREGLLYRSMDTEVRARDPLIAAARRFGQDQSRFGEDGALLYAWLFPVFAEDPPEWRRWLCAACHLADVAWQASPDFRAERGLEMALHGNWVGIDAAGRAMLGQALFTNFGGGTTAFPIDRPIISADMTERAVAWGLAIRLAQRLGAGTHKLLARTRLLREDGVLVLQLPAGEHALGGELVERRLRRLASALALEHRIDTR